MITDDPLVLMGVTLVVAVAYIVVLLHYTNAIAGSLAAIGDREPSVTNRGGLSRSFVSRIWFGVTAIEKQVSALGPEATALNANLKALATALGAVEKSVSGTLTAAGAQPRYRGKGAS